MATERSATPSDAPKVPALRIAFLVYNDVHGDSRVLKVAKTMERAGADVRIFAVSSDSGRYPGGLDRGLWDLDIVRIPPNLLQTWARRVRARNGAGVHPTRVISNSSATLPTTSGAAPPTSGLPGRLKMRAGAAYALVTQWSFWRRVVAPVVEWAPDVVHAHDANTLPPAVRISRITGAALVYDSHELWTDRNVVRPRPFRDWLDARIEERGIRAAHGVISVSPNIVQFLREKYQLAEQPSLVRNVPPREEAKSTDAVSPELRVMSGLSSADSIVAYCGSITTNRGIEATIDCLPLLPDDHHFVLLGEGQPGYLRSLESRAREVGVMERVHFVGRVDSSSVANTMAGADVSVVFTVPVCRSYLWSLPNKLFESIHAGVPVVASDIPDVADLVERHGLGVTTPIDDVHRLARAIRSAIDGKDEYRRNAIAAKEFLNWEIESQTLLDLYAKVTGRQLRSAPTRSGDSG